MYLLQEVTPKRPVLMVISLAGIKVCCPQGQVMLYFKSLFTQSFYVSTETYFIVVCYIFIAVKTLIENMLD